jgi:hypothetical protein
MVHPQRDAAKDEKDKTFRRLPKCVVPIHYNLTFQPDRFEPLIDGRMSVRVEVRNFRIKIRFIYSKTYSKQIF